MRVRSRPDERRRKKREDAPKHSRFPFWKAACAFGAERFLLTGKRGWFPLSPRLRAGDHDTRHRLPTRQMGWPALGWNQQDPWGASERLETAGLPAWLSMHLLYSANNKLSQKIQTAAIDGESVRRGGKAHAASVCRPCGGSTP